MSSSSLTGIDGQHSLVTKANYQKKGKKSCSFPISAAEWNMSFILNCRLSHLRTELKVLKLSRVNLAGPKIILNYFKWKEEMLITSSLSPLSLKDLEMRLQEMNHRFYTLKINP